MSPKPPSYGVVIARLIEARRGADMTQRQLAAALGKPPSFVAKIERGERRLDVIEFIAIARALKLKEGDLLREISADLPKRIEI